jgi:hypothetical protein
VLRVVKAASSCRKAKTVKHGKHRVRIPGEAAIAWNQQGRPGANGTTGSPGTPGATNVTIRLATFVADSTRMSGHVHVDCHPGERAVGGGIGWTQSPGSGDAITYSGPIDANFTTFTFPGQGATPTGWAGEIRTSDSPGKPGQIYVICASP